MIHFTIYKLLCNFDNDGICKKFSLKQVKYYIWYIYNQLKFYYYKDSLKINNYNNLININFVAI